MVIPTAKGVNFPGPYSLDPPERGANLPANGEIAVAKTTKMKMKVKMTSAPNP